MKKLSRKERKLNPETEDQKDYIGYQGVQLYAKTDIPLTSRPTVVLSPTTVWEGYQAEEKTNPTLVPAFSGECRYTFEVEDDFIAEARIYHPSREGKRAVILLGDYGCLPQEEIAKKFAEEGYVVCLPDYCGVFPDTLTSFPPRYAYGKSGQGKEHLTSVCPTPQDTCNYLYAKIIRRTVTFLQEEFDINNPVLVAVKKSTEYAMQAAGIDRRIRALACLCGCGYSEFLQHPRFKGDFLPVEKNLAWISGVSGITYLRHRPLPLFIGIGSNDTGSDIDRIADIEEMLGKNNVCLNVSNGFSDNINATTFDMLLRWTRLTFLNASFPSSPTVDVTVNEEGTAYINVHADASVEIKKTTVYYAVNTVNHESRCWSVLPAETIGQGEYLAKLSLFVPSCTLFYYADVEYENGTVVSGSLVRSAVENVLPVVKKNSTCIFAYGEDDDTFNEWNPLTPVLFQNGIVRSTTPMGLKGIVCKTGSMIVFPGDITESVKENKLLQIDSFSEENEYTLTVTLLDEKLNKYTASCAVESYSTFEPAQFDRADFKDMYFRSPPSWRCIKGLMVENKNVLIGKLLFV